MANAFKKEEIRRAPSGDYITSSISSLAGRHYLTEYLAGKNVGYGQMGNMSIAFYLRDDRREILVCGCDLVISGFTIIGEMSLDVWRWMCADMETLEHHDEPIPEDSMTVDVVSGLWEIEHMYDVTSDDRDMEVYSRLSLIG